MPKARHIALALDTRDSFSRAVRRGACRFAIPGHDWVTRGVRVTPAGFASLRDWPLHGLIVSISDPDLLPLVAALDCPVVNLRTHVDTPGLTTVGLDDAAIGTLAAEHLIARGLRHVAFLGSATDSYADRQVAAFSARLATEGIEPIIFRGRTLDPADDPPLRDWLASLPRPTGVFAADDRWALRASELAREAGLSVPIDVALLGVGDDEMCRMTWPPLSSVAVPAEQAGYEAAKRLEAMLRGQAVEERLTLLPPIGVTARQSTDLIAVNDADVAAAMRYIRDHCHLPIGVPEVVEQTTINRRWLEVRFRRTLGTSILDQLRRARLDRARQMLSDTDRTIDQIARATGLGSGQRLAIVFKQTLGQSPSDYRKQFQLR